MWCLEVAECFGVDICTRPDYLTQFDTYEECKEYCDKENRINGNSCYIQPHKMNEFEIQQAIWEEECLDSLIDRI